MSAPYNYNYYVGEYTEPVEGSSSQPQRPGGAADDVAAPFLRPMHRLPDIQYAVPVPEYPYQPYLVRGYFPQAAAPGRLASQAPTHTKKNTNPRINKLNQEHREGSADRMPYEYSLDGHYAHFVEILKLDQTAPRPHFYTAKTAVEAKLLDMFVHQVAKCMDIFLPFPVFRDIIPQLALLDDTGMILDAIFCLSALMHQRENADQIDAAVPMNYYHQAIKSVRHYLSLPAILEDNGIIHRCLLSTIMLCIYEMFFLAADPTYIKGAVSILSSIVTRNTDAAPIKNSPFFQTCYWAMFISDLILSLKFNQPCMFSVEGFWSSLDPTYFDAYTHPRPCSNDLFMSRWDTSWWLHKAMINFSLTSDFSRRTVVLTKDDYSSNRMYVEWLKLKARVQEFENELPQALKPIIYKPSSDVQVYPTVFFRDELSALIGLQFRLTKIALHEGLVNRTDITSPQVEEELSRIPKNQAKLLAKDIVGILQTYDRSLELWPVNIHTVRQVARYLHDDEKEYKALEQLMERIIETCHFIFKTEVIIGPAEVDAKL